MSGGPLRSSEPDILEIIRTTEPDGRSTRRLKVQDPERLSHLAFKSTEDPYVPQIPWKYRGRQRNVKPRNLKIKTEIRKIVSVVLH